MNEDEFKKKMVDIKRGFEDCKDVIGATKTNWIMLPKELFDISKKLNNGEPVSSVEILKIKKQWKSQDPLIDENGKPFVLYIPDNSKFNGRTQQRVYHVAWCPVLEKMERAGRRARYAKKSDINNNNFKLNNGRGIHQQKELPACLICEGKMRHIVAPDKLYYLRYGMDIVKFFKKYGKQDLKDIDNPDYPVDYPDNWDAIAINRKERADWICSKCDTDYSSNKPFLDVHHKNGITDDTLSNLEVLCKKCHADEPFHGHYKALLAGKGII